MTRYRVTPPRASAGQPRTQLQPLEPSFQPEVVERSGVRLRALQPLAPASDPALPSPASDPALPSPASDSALPSPASDPALPSPASDSALPSPASDPALPSPSPASGSEWERVGVRVRSGDPTIETHEVFLDELADPEMRAFLEAEYAASLEPDPLVEAREIYLDELQGLDPETRALLEAECGPGPDQSWEKLQVKVDFDGANCFFSGLSMDVSDGGLFVTTYQPSAVGTKVMLFVSLPDGHALTAPGEVKFVMDHDIDGDETPHGMGVTFLRLSEEDLAAIRKFCRKRPPTYYDLD